ncbi:hypothetical protein PUV54_07150 [Hyphococcus flavus]|uniref:Uncharacterized protein n=1 Tax=Hyphococcus flavus TaxID=1866326 RepID=A0AAE9ZH63_9PROT|nr:hypothetical protein [Hyphococcus flavus]WDI32973.1 hypothetical protein PUV54_07150 [Hyphococcus flavus]
MGIRLIVTCSLAFGALIYSDAVAAPFLVKRIKTVRDYIHTRCMVNYLINPGELTQDGDRRVITIQNVETPGQDTETTDPEQIVDEIYRFNYRSGDSAYGVELVIYRARKSDFVVSRSFNEEPSADQFFDAVEVMRAIADRAEARCDISLGRGAVVTCEGFSCPVDY